MGRWPYTHGDFLAAAEVEFDWLVTDFGFRVIGRDSFDDASWSPRSSTLTLATSQTYVEVVLEWYSAPNVVVIFGPLMDGKVPSRFPNPTQYIDGKYIHQSNYRYDLKDLLVVRGHDGRWAEKVGHVAHLDEGEIRDGLGVCAAILRKEGAGVLAGDHSVFVDLGAIGQARLQATLDAVYGFEPR